jgi:hypothetical protein
MMSENRRLIVCRTQKHREGKRISVLTFALIAALGWQFSSGMAPARAQGSCPCKFKEAPWEAYGTKAACTTYTRKGGTSCEVEFGGVGADPRLVAQILAIDPSRYQTETYDLLSRFLQYLRDNKKEQLVEPQFLSAALLVFMRGAYLRGPLDGDALNQTKSLDAAVRNFLEKYSGQISKVFTGSDKEFSEPIGNANFTVGKGYIIIRHTAGLLTTRYIPAE